MTIDWGVGRYERTAEQLLPAAREVIAVAAPSAGERVLDVGCGTGNAALLAAERGARVVGVDPAARLLEVARGRAADAALSAEFLAGEAAALPVPDASFDVVVSVFAAIFAPDPAAALAGMARALAPAGRMVLSTWVPGNAVSRMNQLVMGAVREAAGLPEPPPGFAWHEPDQVRPLAAEHGLDVTFAERTIAFTGASVQDYFDGEAEHHPMAITGRSLLEQQGRWDDVRRRALDVLAEGNENPSAFRVTSHYRILTLTR